jgi:hypothetical protein
MDLVTGMSELIPTWLNWGNMVTLAIWGFAALVVLGCAIGGVFYFILMQKTVPGIVIDFNRRIQRFNGRYKKDSSKIEQFWMGRFRKFVPKLSTDDTLINGKQDFVVMLKDHNGLHHILRVPTYEELKKWYKVVHDIDITDTKVISNSQDGKVVKQNLIKEVYFAPNPHETIEWLADKCVESNEEFRTQEWFKHPNVIMFATLLICMITMIMFWILKKYWEGV